MHVLVPAKVITLLSGSAYRRPQIGPPQAIELGQNDGRPTRGRVAPGRVRGGWLAAAGGDVDRRARDRDLKGPDGIEVETALLTRRSRSIEWIPASSWLVVDEQECCVRWREEMVYEGSRTVDCSWEVHFLANGRARR